ncbi:alpha/beta fold hydrolase [Ilumatobacter sp.]|uniref:alpha/beta fold hydrolase n=1 Tax=Ilumatobacter sp. TaxID=1967498 RepID=UPI003AF4995B
MSSVEARTVRLPGSGLSLAADLYGDESGPPVLLLHGGGQTRHAWGGAAAAFGAAGRFAISIDLRGHGHSDWSPDGVYGMNEFAADVNALASSLGRQTALVGASLGGLASLVAVGEADSPIASSLVLVDVAPRIEVEGRVKIQEFMRAGLRGFDSLDEAADSIATFVPHRPRPTDLSGLRKNLRHRGDGRWYWHWDPRWLGNNEGVDGQNGLVHHDRMCAAARRVDIPTLLVRGRMSDIVSDESVRELRELIPHAEVVDVAGAGHMVAGDRNDLFNAAVIDFVGRHATAGG